MYLSHFLLNRTLSSITWELPGHIPFEATKVLVQEYTSMWGDPAHACFRDIVDNTTRLLQSLLSEHFGQFSQLEAYVKWVYSSNYLTLSASNPLLYPGLWSLRIETDVKAMPTICFK